MDSLNDLLEKVCGKIEEVDFKDKEKMKVVLACTDTVTEPLNIL